MDAQEIFDKVSRHLLAQRERSEVPLPYGTSCRYRGPRGLKCAVGRLIEDDEYSPDFENATIGDLVCNRGVLLRFKPHLQLLLDMQKIHDDVGIDPSEWRRELNTVAENHGLEMRA